jgi:HK97 gp10 family phage protein
MGLKASISVKIDSGKIQGILARVGQAVYNGVETGAKVIQESAQSIVPVDTGWLKDSISVEIGKGIGSMAGGGSLSSSAFSVTAQIAPHAEYAAYVEYGTGSRGAASPGAGDGPYNSSWAGMVAQPYMRPAYDENKGHVGDFIAAEVSDVLK